MSRGDYRKFQILLQQPVDIPPNIDETVEQYVKRIQKGHKKRFAKSMRRHFGVEVSMMEDDDVGESMRQAIQQNVGLIKTIPGRFHKHLVSTIEERIATKPGDMQLLTGILNREFKSTGYNLRRLARDQNSKLISRFNQARQQQIGIKEYVWRTAGDDRVRDTHQRNDGRTFRWDTTPSVTGHPGDDIQCRCQAMPVIRKVALQYLGGVRKAEKRRHRGEQGIASKLIGTGVAVGGKPLGHIVYHVGVRKANQALYKFVYSEWLANFAKRRPPKDVWEWFPSYQHCKDTLGTSHGHCHGTVAFRRCHHKAANAAHSAPAAALVNSTHRSAPPAAALQASVTGPRRAASYQATAALAATTEAAFITAPR